MATVGLACTVYVVAESEGRAGKFLLFGLLGFALLFGMNLWFGLRVASQTSIVPYFQKQVGEIDTFARGYAVARSCQALDELSSQLGLTPLSAFGFNDDLAGETLIWHPSEQGLETFTGLLAAVRDRPKLVPRHDELVKELTKIVEALQKATDRSIPFCLLLRTCDSTSSLEWERRKGTCF